MKVYVCTLSVKEIYGSSMFQPTYDFLVIFYKVIKLLARDFDRVIELLRIEIARE